MGSLTGRHYPTKLALKCADHTYVECGSGQVAWSCWGGKANGDLLGTAAGSTRRADVIAEPDERAGITCYLINGVCHQAANRILLPAGITVDGARGYSLSVSIFGLYGRPKAAFGLCKAPFDTQDSVSGDLPECMAGGPTAELGEAEDDKKQFDYMDRTYMSAVMGLYEADYLDAASSKSLIVDFQVEQFKLLVRHKLPRFLTKIESPEYNRLISAREDFERERLEAEERFSESNEALAFVDEFNALTLEFQDEVARALDRDQYRALLDLSPDERIVLADPEIVQIAYEPRNGPRGMSP